MVKGTNRVDGNCDSRPSTSVEHVEHGIRHFSRKVLDLVDCIDLERQLITTPALFSSTFYLSFFLSSFYIYILFCSSFRASVPFSVLFR